MPKETINSLNKKIANLKSIADSLLLVIDPDFKNASILLRNYCIVKYDRVLKKYNILESCSTDHYRSLIYQKAILEDIINDLDDLLKKSGIKETVVVDVIENNKVKSLGQK